MNISCSLNVRHLLIKRLFRGKLKTEIVESGRRPLFRFIIDSLQGIHKNDLPIEIAESKVDI